MSPSHIRRSNLKAERYFMLVQYSPEFVALPNSDNCKALQIQSAELYVPYTLQHPPSGR